jgi:hypothetical protein
MWMLRKRTFGVLAVLLATGVGASAPSTLAGSGTQADPYRNITVNYGWTYQGRVTSVYQDITSTASLGGASDFVQYWAFNPRFSLTSGFYTGLQRNGILLGQGVKGTKVPKSVQFSLFSNGQSASFRMLDGTNCTLGADSLDQATGVSCSIAYAWAGNQPFRLTVNIYEGATGAWCAAGTPICTVYQGLIAPVSNLSATTQISAWSIDPGTYGRVGNASSFLENLNVNHSQYCGPLNNVSGDFVVPFKVDVGSSYPVSAVTGSDRFVRDLNQSPPPQILACAWQWNVWVISKVTY